MTPHNKGAELPEAYLVKCVTNGCEYTFVRKDLAEHFISTSKEGKGGTLVPLYSRTRSDRFPDIIQKLCGDDVNGGFIRDLCFTVWSLCHYPKHKDGNCDWSSDTLPTVQEGVKKIRALLEADRPQTRSGVIATQCDAGEDTLAEQLEDLEEMAYAAQQIILKHYPDCSCNANLCEYCVASHTRKDAEKCRDRYFSEQRAEQPAVTLTGEEVELLEMERWVKSLAVGAAKETAVKLRDIATGKRSKIHQHKEALNDAADLMDELADLYLEALSILAGK